MARADRIAIDTVDGVATLRMADAASVGLLGSDPEHVRATAADEALFVDRGITMDQRVEKRALLAGSAPLARAPILV